MKEQYWLESVQSSFDEHGIVATEEQIKAVAQDIGLSHDSIGLAFYTPESPYKSEVEELKRKLKIEQSKIVCDKCNGTGWIHSQGPHHGSSSQCFNCHGEGYHVPK